MLASSALVAAATAVRAEDFQGLGTLGGTYSAANGVSGDGTVVVGESFLTGNFASHPFRWTQSGGMADLGTLGGTSGAATGASSDGAVVAGFSYLAGNTTSHAFRWTQSGGLVDLGTLGGTFSVANGLSSDGSVVVGDSAIVGFGTHAFRWTQGGGIADLGTLGGQFSWAYSVSGDGAVAVGASTIVGNAAIHIFRWTQSGGMADLGTLGGPSGAATAVSRDGAVVAGFSAVTGNTAEHAFRWTQSDGMVDLGTLPGGTNSRALGINADGTILVGQSDSTTVPSGEAFRWTSATGMKSIRDLLVASGVNMAGWELTGAQGVSASGNVIVGYGENPSSQTEAWIARLCDLPGTCQSGGNGLITVSDQMMSFSSLGAVGRTASASLGMNFNTVMNYAAQGGTPTSPGSPFSVFTTLGYDSDPTVAGTLGGTAKLNDRGLIGGVTVGADNIHTTDMYAGGSSRMNAGTIGAFVAQVPEGGWQWLAGVNAIYLTGKIARGYLNGASEVTSTGSTHGRGYGLAGRIGYTFADVMPHTALTPFVSYTYTHVTFAGYTETDGPFPAEMNSFHNIEQTSRVGADARYTFKPGTWIWGTLAWGHRLDAGKSPDVSGTLIGLFPLSTTGNAIDQRDWAETTAGIRFGAWKNGAVTASLTASIPAKAPTTYVTRLGISRAF